MKIKKILVSQPKPTTDKSPYFDITEKYGVKINFRPFIKVEPISPQEFRAQKVSIAEHTAVLFTARTGVDHFFRMCTEMRVTMPETTKYFCLSKAIADYLQKYIQFRKRKVFYSENGKISELGTMMKKHSGDKYLVVLAELYNEEIVKCLIDNKLQYNIGIMYRTVSNDFQPEETFDYDMLVFFSPIGISSLFKNFPNFEQGEIQVACFGATTSQAAREAGLRLDLEVPTPKSPSMAAALYEFVKENHKLARKS